MSCSGFAYASRKYIAVSLWNTQQRCVARSNKHIPWKTKCRIIHLREWSHECINWWIKQEEASDGVLRCTLSRFISKTESNSQSKIRSCTFSTQLRSGEWRGRREQRTFARIMFNVSLWEKLNTHSTASTQSSSGTGNLCSGAWKWETLERNKNAKYLPHQTIINCNYCCSWTSAQVTTKVVMCIELFMRVSWMSCIFQTINYTPPNIHPPPWKKNVTRSD